MKDVMKRHIYISLLIALITGIIVVSLISAVFVSKKPMQSVVSPAPGPTNIPLQPAAPLLLVSFAPQQNQTDVSIFATISATFSRPVSNQEKKHISTTTTPAIPGTISWSTDNRTFTFTPNSLNTSQQYAVALQYNNVSYAWSFTTVSEDTLSTNDKEQLQVQSDDIYAQWEDSVNKDYPWYNNLPLDSDLYYVYFDLDKKQLIGYLFIDQSKTNEANQLKTDITNQLKSFNIPLNKFPVVWIYQP